MAESLSSTRIRRPHWTHLACFPLVSCTSHSFLIVIFGEIVPQAACQRYSLEVGSTMAPVMRVVMYLLFPVAYPLSKGLDFALGEELATTYSSSEMIKLLQIHVNEQIIDSDTATAMKGALKYKDMTVKEVMTPLANVFMLSAEERLNFETIAKIFKTGYSRIPVYHVSKVRTTRRMAFVLVSGFCHSYSVVLGTTHVGGCLSLPIFATEQCHWLVVCEGFDFH